MLKEKIQRRAFRQFRTGFAVHEVQLLRGLGMEHMRQALRVSLSVCMYLKDTGAFCSSSFACSGMGMFFLCWIGSMSLEDVFKTVTEWSVFAKAFSQSVIAVRTPFASFNVLHYFEVETLRSRERLSVAIALPSPSTMIIIVFQRCQGFHCARRITWSGFCSPFGSFVLVQPLVERLIGLGSVQ